MTSADAPAKINLALVVGAGTPTGSTRWRRCSSGSTSATRSRSSRRDALAVDGFADDTIVTRALEAVAAAAGIEPRWRVRIEKRIPVAAGLGGGSSDAATALRLANDTLPEPLLARAAPRARRERSAPTCRSSSRRGRKLGTGDGSTLEPLALPQDYAVLLLLPHGARQGVDRRRLRGASTAAAGFAERRARVLEIASHATAPADLAALPPNDLASSPLAAELVAAGAFRADVSGAGPTLYGLFPDRAAAERAAAQVGHLGRVWIADPAW